MIILIIIGFILFVIGHLLSKGKYCSDWELLKILGIALIVIVGIIKVVSYCELQLEIERYHSVRESVNSAREAENIIESAALQRDIIEINAYIAKAQYANKWFIIGDFVPDEFDELEAIQ